MKLLLFIINLLLILINSFGQLMTNNNISVFISTGTTITVEGGITSSGTTTISNNGTITLTGDFINNSNNNLFGTTAGTVSMNGPIQNIGGSASTMFNNLILSGTGDKILLTNTLTGGSYPSPAGILQLNDKILFLNSKLLTINNNNPGAITRTTGFIQSETNPSAGYSQIKWMTGNTTMGSVYIFPFGISAGSIYLPLQMQITNAGNGPSGSFTISTYSTSSNNLPLPTGVPGILNSGGTNNSDKVLDRYWIIEPADYVTLPVSNLTFTYRDIEHTQPTNLINESLLQMQFNNGSVWSPTPVGNVSTGLNSIVVNGVNNYSFAWTAVDNSSPLPIELISFNAELINNKEVKCEWLTASELNNDYFTIQRSKDGIEIINVGFVDAAGNSNSILAYSFTDINPFNGISYYRLMQTDFDGKFSYTHWVPVQLVKSNEILIYPNPANDYLILHSVNQSEQLNSIKIINALGQIIFEDSWNNKLKNSLTIETKEFTPGLYNLLIENSEAEINNKIFIYH